MTMTAEKPRTPTICVARVLRGLGLKQGRSGDFIVRSLGYRRGERIGTIVHTKSRHANEVIAAHADQIEAETAAAGHGFRVQVYARADDPTRLSGCVVVNVGPSVREIANQVTR